MPATVPLSSELQERCSGDEDRGGTEIETPRILAGAILDCAEQRGKKESTEATGGAYEAGENTDALRESLRNELEDGAVAHAEHAHGKKEKRNFHVERRKGANHEEQDGNRAEQCEQKAIATYFVGEPAADGAKKAPG